MSVYEYPEEIKRLLWHAAFPSVPIPVEIHVPFGVHDGLQGIITAIHEGCSEFPVVDVLFENDPCGEGPPWGFHPRELTLL